MKFYHYILVSLVVACLPSITLYAQTYKDFGNHTDLVAFTTSKAPNETFTFTLAPDETDGRPQNPIVFIDWTGSGNRQMINLIGEESFEVKVPASKEITVTGENGLWTVKAVDQSVTQAVTSKASILKHLDLDKNLLGKEGSAGSDYVSNTKLETLSLSENYYKALPLSENKSLKNLRANSNLLREIDLTGLDQMEHLSLKRNLLTKVKMPANAAHFATIDLSINRLNIATLPTMPRGMTADKYLYTLQERYKLPKDKFKVSEAIDLSDQNNASGILDKPQPTTYAWYEEIDPAKDNYKKLTDGEDYTVKDGKTYFLRNVKGNLFVAMTTPAFPGLESFERKVNADTYAFVKDGNEQIQLQPDAPNTTLPYEQQINDMVDGRTRKVYRSNPMTIGLNYWHGTISNEWKAPGNWTGNFVPLTLLSAETPVEMIADVEFATEVNNDTTLPNKGAARRNLHVGEGESRVVRNLINESETGKATVVPAGASLRILGRVSTTKATGVYGDVAPAYRLLVASQPEKPNGTLFFDNPGENKDLFATVEFYSKGYDGNFDKQHAGWQYFGTPVAGATVTQAFPSSAVIRKYTQGKNNEYDEKWVQTNPSDGLYPFHGYEITQPVPATYRFKGKLNFAAPSDLTVAAPVEGVPYGAFNAFANSYTAAYNVSAIAFGEGLEKTVYLFNTGSRVQWIDKQGTPLGALAGQYVSIPVAAAATIPELPKEIPSLQGFMVRNAGTTSATLRMPYSGIIKGKATNELRSGSDHHLSAEPIDGYMLIDVASERGADRMILIQKPGTTRAFDNAWDGSKLFAIGRPQLYAIDKENAYQVSTSDQLHGTPIGFRADESGSYTISFTVSEPLWNVHKALYLKDLQTGAITAIANTATYTFTAARGQAPGRFEIISGEEGLANSLEPGIRVYGLEGLRVRVDNTTALEANIAVYDLAGTLIRTIDVAPRTLQDLQLDFSGNYIVKASNSSCNTTTKIVLND